MQSFASAIQVFLKKKGRNSGRQFLCLPRYFSLLISNDQAKQSFLNVYTFLDLGSIFKAGWAKQIISGVASLGGWLYPICTYA